MVGTIKANPFRWLWNQVQQAYHKLRGDSIVRTVEPTPSLRDEFIDKGGRGGWMSALHDALGNGDINIQRWTLDFRSKLKDTYISEYILGRGGRNAMTQSDWGKVGHMLRDQYGYLNNFADDIAAGKMSAKQIQMRADLYFKSARQAYERGAEAMRGMPYLPAYPGDGSTQCLSNCQCQWIVRESETEWQATWSLGAAEHCPDCVQRSQDWNPLRLPKQ